MALRAPRRDAVLLHQGVARHQDHALLQRLSDEHAVERVSVECRQRCGPPGMAPPDRQLNDARVRSRLVDRGRCRQSAGGSFDRRFPDARSAEEDLVRTVCDGVPSVFRETCRVVCPPERDMGVEKDFQVPKSSSSSGIGASKLASIRAFPCH